MVGIIITGVILLGALLIIIVSISIYCHRKLRFVYACIIVANCMRIVFNMFMYIEIRLFALFHLCMHLSSIFFIMIILLKIC